jgi:hypothetical protein
MNSRRRAGPGARRNLSDWRCPSSRFNNPPGGWQGHRVRWRAIGASSNESGLGNRSVSPLLLRLDRVELGQRAFKFVVEEPHRIENFAEGCG